MILKQKSKTKLKKIMILNKLDPNPKMQLFPKEESIKRKERKPKQLSPEYVMTSDMHQLLNSLKRHATTNLK